MRNQFALLFLLLFSFVSIAQTNRQLVDSALYYYQSSKLQKIEFILKRIDTTKLSPREKAGYYISKARAYSYESKFKRAANNALKSKVIYEKLNDERMQFQALDVMVESYMYLAAYADKNNEWYNDLCALSNKLSPNEKALCIYYTMVFESINKEINAALTTAKKGAAFSKLHHLEKREQEFIANVSMLFKSQKELDSAIVYTNKSVAYFKNKNNDQIVSSLYLNLSGIYSDKNDFDKALEYIDLSKELNTVRTLDYLNTFHKSRAHTLKNLGRYDEATIELERVIAIKDSITSQNLANQITELETKYETEKKQKVNLELTAKNQRNQITIIAMSGIGAILLLTAGLVYTNLRKKQRIAAQERQIEKQRMDANLKNQELATIDAMIAGQEKERKKLAEELHDNLGSTLTTVRLYFDNIKENWTENTNGDIFNRTSSLLDEAYKKIRTMSHTRHHGVLASKGLIPTLESLSQKLSDSGKIQVTVIHHGLDKKLDNTLELTIFRVIQKLLSNIVKHAQATEASVSLTAYEQFINLMIEDNGVGFESIKLPESDGMGLSSIEKRIENLDGTFEIDSQIGYGTTINIDIPLL